MQLNDIEKNILHKLFEGNRLLNRKTNNDFFDINVVERRLTGSGFFTDFEQTETLKYGKTGHSCKIENIGAILNGITDTGYLIYIENGYITTIEGFTYEEEWPEKIKTIKACFINFDA